MLTNTELERRHQASALGLSPGLTAGTATAVSAQDESHARRMRRNRRADRSMRRASLGWTISL